MFIDRRHQLITFCNLTDKYSLIHRTTAIRLLSDLRRVLNVFNNTHTVTMRPVVTCLQVLISSDVWLLYADRQRRRRSLVAGRASVVDWRYGRRQTSRRSSRHRSSLGRLVGRRLAADRVLSAQRYAARRTTHEQTVPPTDGVAGGRSHVQRRQRTELVVQRRITSHVNNTFFYLQRPINRNTQ